MVTVAILRNRKIDVTPQWIEQFCLTVHVRCAVMLILIINVILVGSCGQFPRSATMHHEYEVELCDNYSELLSCIWLP